MLNALEVEARKAEIKAQLEESLAQFVRVQVTPDINQQMVAAIRDTIAAKLGIHPDLVDGEIRAEVGTGLLPTTRMLIHLRRPLEVEYLAELHW